VEATEMAKLLRIGEDKTGIIPLAVPGKNGVDVPLADYETALLLKVR